MNEVVVFDVLFVEGKGRGKGRGVDEHDIRFLLVWMYWNGEDELRIHHLNTASCSSFPRLLRAVTW